MVLGIAAIFVLAVTYSVFSTTISSNINTDGTLTVSDKSSLSGGVYASSTLQGSGNSYLYGSTTLGTASSSPTTDLNVFGALYVTNGLGVGFATTGNTGVGAGGAGNLHVLGLGVFENRLGVNGSTSPSTALGVGGSALIGTGVGSTLTLNAGTIYQPVRATTTIQNVEGAWAISTSTSGVPFFVVNGMNGYIGLSTSTPVLGLSVATSTYIHGGLGVGYATTSIGDFRNTGFTLHGGRVGINGSTSPTVELGVIGSAYIDTGLGVGYATTGSGHVKTTGLAVIGGRVGVNASSSPTAELGVDGSAMISTGLGVGYATSGSGDIRSTGFTQLGGRLAVNGTSSPYQEVSAVGDAALVTNATTTASLDTTSTTQSGCIELREANGPKWVRIYVSEGGATSTNAFQLFGTNLTSGAGGAQSLLMVELGRCQ